MSETNTVQMLSLTVVTSASGGGQKIVSVAVEYSDVMSWRDLSPQDYQVEGFTLVDVCTSETVRG